MTLFFEINFCTKKYNFNKARVSTYGPADIKYRFNNHILCTWVCVSIKR